MNFQLKEFLKYQSFNIESDFRDVIDCFETHNINFQTEDYPVNFIADPNNLSFSHEYVIKLEPQSFQRANEVLEKEAHAKFATLEKDYYLFSYSNQELIEVLKQQDEWNKFDVALAKKLLSDQGISHTPEDLKEFEQERMVQLSAPEKSQQLWIFLGYLSASVGGLFGLFIGWHLFSHRRVLPNGEKVFDYSEKDRKQGKTIFFISLIVLLISFSIILFNF